MSKIYSRKFLVKALPNIVILREVTNKRFYLYIKNNIVIRVQSEDNLYEIERKSDKSHLLRESSKIDITKNEYEALSKLAEDTVERRTITFLQYPQLKVRIYEGAHKGLIRAEINFLTEREAITFTPYSWFDKEITDSPLGKDATLVRLSPVELEKHLK